MDGIIMDHCTLCPRRCGADREKSSGLCGGGAQLRVARAALHFWEEPCISGTNGSGTIFFSGCPLQCCFCQNHTISSENYGKEITTERLSEIFMELQEQNAHNINLVSPTQYVPWILKALDKVRHRLKIPVVYNTGGYETVQTLRSLEGYVDIYLPDLKYFGAGPALKYSGASDYFEKASRAVTEMFRQVGAVNFDNMDLLKKGLIIRHMTLPGYRRDSMDVLQWISQQFSPEEIRVSVMSQYTPFYKSAEHKEINRRISTFEYNSVVNQAENLGLTGYMQERSSAKEEYTPAFDLQGL